MWLKPVRFYFRKLIGSGSRVIYYDPSCSYFIQIEGEDGILTVNVMFTLPTYITDEEIIPEVLRKQEIAREIHKEFLRIYNVGEDIFAERPRAFDLTINTLAKD